MTTNGLTPLDIHNIFSNLGLDFYMNVIYYSLIEQRVQVNFGCFCNKELVENHMKIFKEPIEATCMECKRQYLKSNT